MTATQTTPAPYRSSTPTSQYTTPRETRGLWWMIGGGLVALLAVALVAIGGAAIYLDTQRDSAGYVSTDMKNHSTPTYAFVSDSYRGGSTKDIVAPVDVLGTIRIKAQSAKPLFVGIARASAVDSYLAGVAHETITGLDAGQSKIGRTPGEAPSGAPAGRHIWSASTVGSGTQVLTWKPKSGDWRVVLMNPDASSGINADVSIGAKLPHVVEIGLGLIGVGLLACGIAALMFARGMGRLETRH